MQQDVINSEQVHTYRPMFLSILCVLGFIGSIISIAQNAIGVAKAEVEVAQIQSGTSKTQLKNIFAGSNSSSAEPLVIGNLTADNFQKFSIGGIVSALLCLIGVVMMWMLKKSGFYSFTLGTFFNIITHFLLFGENIGAMGLSLVGAILGLVLVILFSRYLNYMD